MFVVASPKLPDVILSGIKRCDSRQGNSVSSTVRCSKTVCAGNNLITQTTYKTSHSDKIDQALSLSFVQYALISLKYSYNHISS